MFWLTQVLETLVIATVPLSLIGAATYLLSMRMKFNAQKIGAISAEEKQLIQQVLQDNQELKERIGHIESIVTSLDTDISHIKEATKTILTEEEAKKLLER